MRQERRPEFARRIRGQTGFWQNFRQTPQATFSSGTSPTFSLAQLPAFRADKSASFPLPAANLAGPGEALEALYAADQELLRG